ncbi:gamma-glutamyltransferase [Pseudooceanicola sp. MF1-13]|uniref:gamma-glutamyltransferase n=1 Tax=Pseudooceanicola sp. MF1-13 TaxID=3379095 RepID=UPI00389270C1
MAPRLSLRLAPVILSLACALPVAAQQATDAIPPEMTTDLSAPITDPALRTAQEAKQAGRPVTARNWMISAAHPMAVQAGADVLRQGGTAADAMVAAQAMLGLVEPQSSGLGGGGFVLYFDAESGRLSSLDGRETAPRDATPRLFQTEGGEPMGFFQAVVGGLSVGVPGTPALMEGVHQRWGRLPWPDLLAPAISAADQGFEVSARLAAMVGFDQDRLILHPKTAGYFLPEGDPINAGDLLINTAYADTLRAFATGGAQAFYEGPLAEEISMAVANAIQPGLLTPWDMRNYTIKDRDPTCLPFQGYEVCGMGPPSSGGLTVAQILGTADAFRNGDLGASAIASDPALSVGTEQHLDDLTLLGNAARLAFADRGRYIADSDYVPVPEAGLIAPDYLSTRAAEASETQAIEAAHPGTPEFDHAIDWADHQGRALPSTTHMSIVDQYGNALSMTSSVENAFGSRVMAAGFLLNNQLTDFSFRSHIDGTPIANRVEPGKRPRSSMAPTIVLKDGKPVLVIGSPGGSRIIGYVAETIWRHLVEGHDIQQAIALPHAVNRFGTYDIETGPDAESLATQLQARGFETQIRGLNSGLHGIAITKQGLQGGADPRREGIAYGE